VTAVVEPAVAPPEELWAPAWHTPILGDATDGPRVARFASTFMVASKGMKAGKPLDFAEWQVWALSHALQKRNGRLMHRQYLLGVPRKTAKSLKGAAICLYYLAGEPHGVSLGRELYSIAGDRQQAKLVLGEARFQVLNHPALSKSLKVYRDAIERPDTGSVYRVLSHDGKLAQGLNPFITVADEVHVYPTSQLTPGTSELWEAMLQGSGARPESLLLGITTAGDYRDDALLTRLFDYGKKIASGEVDDPSFGASWWQAPDGCDHLDESMWHVANPNLALGLADIEEMRSTVKSTPEPVFRRYRLNQMVRLGGSAWMDMAAWKAQARERNPLEEARLNPQKGTRRIQIVAAFDGSVSGDSTAIVGMTVEDGHLFKIGVWEDTGEDDWTVPRDEVNRAVDDMFDLFDVKAFQCDTSYWLAEFQEWQRKFGERKVLDFTMSNARMVPAVQELYSGIVDGQVTHGDDPDLNRHVSNAVIHETPRGVTIKKQSKDSKHKIDLAVTACMANDARLRLPRRRGITKGW
jgi:phage terminase large subunit-like protein